jgi:hypothetical protein
MTSSTHITAGFAATKSDRVMFLVGNDHGHSTCYFQRVDIVAWCEEHHPELIGTDQDGLKHGVVDSLSSDELDACFAFCRQLEGKRNPVRAYEVGHLNADHPYMSYNTTASWASNPQGYR